MKPVRLPTPKSLLPMLPEPWRRLVLLLNRSFRVPVPRFKPNRTLHLRLVGLQWFLL